MNGKEFLYGKHSVTLTGKQWVKLLTLANPSSGCTSVYGDLQYALGFNGSLKDKMDEFFRLHNIRDQLVQFCRHSIPYHLVEDKVLDFFETLSDEHENKKKQKKEIQEKIKALQKQLAELENPR